jgi:transposase
VIHGSLQHGSPPGPLGPAFPVNGNRSRLISTQYVTPFAKTNKHDRNDDEAIVEAASRPTMRFVPVKAVEQQDIQAAHRMRAILLRHRTALIKQMRGLPSDAILRSRGHRTRSSVGPSTAAHQRRRAHLVLPDAADRTPSAPARNRRTRPLHRDLHPLIHEAIGALPQDHQIPGVGPIPATAIVAAVGDARQFPNGRHLAAWLGLVPRQYSSGGKSRLHRISRRGDTYLRTLLIHGARAVLRFVKSRTDVHCVWLQQLIGRREYNCTVLALANRNARVIH